MSITITEALAEIKTIGKRLEKKREFIVQYIGQQHGLRDPLEKEGGSVTALAREHQSIKDLELRIVHLRRAIHKANDATTITVAGITRSISEWVIWRKEVMPAAKAFLRKQRDTISLGRSNAQRHGGTVIQPGQTADKPIDFVININETELAAATETIETIDGELDGQLSLKNATVQIQEG